jgi:hypothetical protein
MSSKRKLFNSTESAPKRGKAEDSKLAQSPTKEAPPSSAAKSSDAKEGPDSSSSSSFSKEKHDSPRFNNEQQVASPAASVSPSVTKDPSKQEKEQEEQLDMAYSMPAEYVNSETVEAVAGEIGWTELSRVGRRCGQPVSVQFYTCHCDICDGYGDEYSIFWCCGQTGSSTDALFDVNLGGPAPENELYQKTGNSCVDWHRKDCPVATAILAGKLPPNAELTPGRLEELGLLNASPWELNDFRCAECDWSFDRKRVPIVTLGDKEYCRRCATMVPTLTALRTLEPGKALWLPTVVNESKKTKVGQYVVPYRMEGSPPAKLDDDYLRLPVSPTVAFYVAKNPSPNVKTNQLAGRLYLRLCQDAELSPSPSSNRSLLRGDVWIVRAAPQPTAAAPSG